MMTNIGERIRIEREKRKLTIRNLALKTNITHSTISRIERNVIKPSADSIEKLANYFGVTADYILYGTKLDEPLKPKTYNVYSTSPLYNTNEYLTIIEIIDKLTRDELIMIKGAIYAVMPHLVKKENNIINRTL